MAKNLVIVESPAKAKTIKKFLGSGYEVMASNGHVRDLPKSTMGIDMEHDYEPKYITIRGKGELLAALRKAVSKADKVYLATDPDREGEAISYHLSVALKLENKNYKRITFNEITKNAVKTSIKNAREIDMNLVDAQQARRVLDRMVGYSISPLLWEKIKRGLSAGRVQSVALKLICDRENEINAFVPEEYWSFDVMLAPSNGLAPVCFHYVKDRLTKEEVDAVETAAKKADFHIDDIKTTEKIKKPPVPFTTSTLQQEAGKHLNFATSKTMRIAQQLYEGVDVKGFGTVGLITYLRTDSIRVSDEADQGAKEFIAQKYGEAYVGTAEIKGTGKKIQDAHEAIRPTNITITPDMVKAELSRDQYRLYQLIYNRFLASRMSAAVFEAKTVYAKAADYKFKTTSTKRTFDGFMSCYALDEQKEEAARINGLNKGDVVKADAFDKKQHFTQPPAHFTEALLVKTMEELGIGRPSTYAPTISTIINRRYIVKENKNLYVTELGEAVNMIMEKAFSVIIDTNFTANIESLLDKIEEGVIDWKVVIRNFYPDLAEAIDNAQAELESIKIEDEQSDVPCELCGRMMVIKYGPYGKFLACPGFPECRNTKPHYEKVGIACPMCGADVVLRKTKKGRKYYGCINNPDCQFMSWAKPTEEKCPECGSYLVEKGSKLMCSGKECGYSCSAKKIVDENH
ncbi:MAG: type I DNA topoisomerase [Clostridium sp.]|nr:type I DNA topoisomerase [Clostridium sp.]MCM1398016.1 type I DNA topoisomerase [Clostridium sp.]MCM1459348.1 type I DNA topoisomerase [Bacteroides sp.]